jgi:phosphohistidine phosphatase
MHQLLLVRHAKSSWDDPKLVDRDRPLNKRGRRAAASMREAIVDLGLIPDMVLTSPALRVQQTLGALEPWDETPLVETIEALYLATANQMLDLLREVNETVRSVMLIGHNPGMQELAGALAASSVDSEIKRRLLAGFPTAALAEFSVATRWEQLSAGGARLVRFLTPKALAESAG